MKKVSGALLLMGLLAAAPSCSDEDGDGTGTGDGDGGDGDGGDGDGDGDEGDGDTASAGDANGDGVLDSFGKTVDIDKDGSADQVDIDGDDEPDGIGVDVNGDGVADGIGVDTDGDGLFDDYEPIDPSTIIHIDFEACASEASEVEALPADILFMIDQSVSMVEHTVPDNTEGAPSRWKVLRDAVIEFIEDEGSAGLRVGLDFFPQPGTAELPSGGNSGVSCDTEDYTTPEVAIGLLPGNADALLAAYPEQPNGGFTPSYPALEGALTHARTWAEMAENAGRGIAVVWVTDGYPTVCEDRTITGLAQLADSYSNPTGEELRVPTFVVGLGPVPNLKTVAQAGGTGDGFFVADNDEAVDDLIESLRRVANSPAFCEYNFPESVDGTPVDKTKINMQFIPSGGRPEVVGRTDGAASCGSNPGWYYDDEDDPTMIHVCPQVCQNFGGGVVSIVAGCETIDIF